MREISLVVPAHEVEGVLDRLLPELHSGVREVEHGDAVALNVRGRDLPPLAELTRLAGPSVLEVVEREISDDWRERRVADYAPDVIGERLVIAPSWAPPSGAELEIVLEEGGAFGSGGHPTTRTCLELLLGIEPAGSFADLGCGSGVLAILAARLGWSPVTAVDISPAAVEAVQGNARSNQVSVQGRRLDLSAEPPPAASGFAANVPADIHRSVAGQLAEPLPVVGLLSGFHTPDANAVLAGYQARGFRLAADRDAHGWSVLLIERPLS